MMWSRVRSGLLGFALALVSSCRAAPSSLPWNGIVDALFGAEGWPERFRAEPCLLVEGFGIGRFDSEQQRAKGGAGAVFGPQQFGAKQDAPGCTRTSVFVVTHEGASVGLLVLAYRSHPSFMHGDVAFGYSVEMTCGYQTCQITKSELSWTGM